MKLKVNKKAGKWLVGGWKITVDENKEIGGINGEKMVSVRKVDDRWMDDGWDG